MIFKNFALVGDVERERMLGLALCDLASGEISRAKTYSASLSSLEAVVQVYLEEHNVKVEDGCIAIACPITGDWALTNHTGHFLSPR